MTGPASFHRLPDPAERSRGTRAVIVGVGLAVFVLVALVKPWDTLRPTVSPAPEAAAPSASAPPSRVGAGVTPSGSAATGLGPAASLAFRLPDPPSWPADWRGLRWRRLGTGDPMTLVASIARWNQGAVAVGIDPPDGSTTPVWTTGDGQLWEPLPAGVDSTFPTGTRILGIVRTTGGLAALLGRDDRCADLVPCDATGSPFAGWVSADSRAWAPRPAPDLQPLEPWRGAVMAAGPAGLVTASVGSPTGMAISVDGDAWQNLPAGTLPAGTAVNALAGTDRGYLLGGTLVSSTRDGGAVILWSTDGRTWSSAPITGPGGGPAVLATRDDVSVIDGFVTSMEGILAHGSWVATPGVDLWLWSRDGREWQVIDGFPPLPGDGPLATSGSSRPVGRPTTDAIVSDGYWMTAIRVGVTVTGPVHVDGGAVSGISGDDAGAWTSFDGTTWRALRLEGDPPTGRPQRAVMFPGGVLVVTQAGTWFGQAITD